ncbi:F0F1 ATP synthase subunit epsilon [Symbiobacterium thermophilum]|uniref:ATP synthase epsilon chain n=1 Tax=Symbiobacterium thermophilum (strain DSM 24528 / JCM 14929 / IAM 14863 / T) TaxID=292459 RepID=ATPE_SYMTH|nr:F0F1 ATP synthase subunit epsilon [Symbiobacterium thermophilum]Q67TB6.1 RecName: Full=ATP synthase epsilon chain; AltName: Full=ATP synthase F1 sector epsilon subunit; AltName: Full=F-ATPase epsilon subunit [Symbiobacterium thermophilum IAM 14863]BAD39077.1 ATP synthase epsilon subunit [Symbiobacterium thermophilum IAM 14863]
MADMSLTIITPERTVLRDAPADAVVVPVVDGSMGILKNHAPMVANLRIGVLRYKQDGVYKRVAVTGGFVEVSENRITVLADAAELAESIDVMRAMEAKRRAEARLRDRKANIDRTRAEAALRRAMVRLRAAGALDHDKD